MTNLLSYWIRCTHPWRTAESPSAVCTAPVLSDHVSIPESATAWAWSPTNTVEASASGSMVSVVEEGVWRTPENFGCSLSNVVSGIHKSEVRDFGSETDPYCLVV